MSREDPQLKLRLTEELKSQVTEAALANKRSVNGEIVARLEGSFASETGNVLALDLASATLADAAEEAALRRYEARATASHLALMRHIATRLAKLQKQPVPEDLKVMLRWLEQDEDAQYAGEIAADVLLAQAMKSLDDLAAAQASHGSPEGEERRKNRVAKSEALNLFLETVTPRK